MLLDFSRGGIETAIELLFKGDVVGIPTETVYGLAGNASNPDAISRIYNLKGRPLSHPVIVHLSSDDDPLAWTSKLSYEAHRLMDAFWPGPLTLILPRASGVLDIVTGGQNTIGLRCPSHPFAQALLKGFSKCIGGKGGVVAPSANRFGHVSPTTAAHVVNEFREEVYVLDGGPCEIGIESTIIDVSSKVAKILRPGKINAFQIAEVLGKMPDLLLGNLNNSPRAPGTFSAHYATYTPLLLLDTCSILRKINTLGEDSSSIAFIVFSKTYNLLPESLRHIGRIISAPNDPEFYARDLYTMLRKLDNGVYRQIYAEKLPETLEWEAVNDRLRRAVAAFHTK